ncbi:MAG: hypothetical protein WCZ90_02495 [Melioribacteraceae bacterium]
MINKIKPFESVRKFYFLEYFYILLRSVEKQSEVEQVFNSFKNLKQQLRLGESKYKKLSISPEALTKVQLDRYRYTLKQVIDESKDYQLIKETKSGLLRLTEDGEILLKEYYNSGANRFNRILFGKMEQKYNAFLYLLSIFYGDVNKNNPGLIVFPIYSPRQLGFDRPSVKKTKDIIDYSNELVKKLEKDIYEQLGFKKSLVNENKAILKRLYDSRLLPPKDTAEFSSNKYNVITKRFRDFWMNYFLKEIYRCEYSMASFDIWAYRGKQIGLNSITEFYPSFNGRIVYPTAIISESVTSKDFIEIHSYPDGKKVFLHEPDINIEKNQEKFIDVIVKSYFNLRKTYKSYFINLLALKELVCYNMKIPAYLFDTFLETVYKLHLSRNLRIKISLEVDKLPTETQAMYLKKEPILIDGKLRNIIAIDVTKEKSNG